MLSRAVIFVNGHIPDLEPVRHLIQPGDTLLAADGVEIAFTEEAIAEMARFAMQVNAATENIGAAIVKHFERTEHARPLIICPATLTEMWERYNEVYQLNARVLSMGYLRERDDRPVQFLKDEVIYRDRNFLLVDESHNFRYADTQRYKMVEAFLG